jgi:hypothetical protein
MASNIETIARNRAMLIQTVTTSLDMLENHPRMGAKAFRDAWNGSPVEDKEQVKRAIGGVHAACFLSSGYILDDRVLIRPAAKVVIEHASFIASVLNDDLDGVFKHLGLPEDACLGEDWATAATDLIKETMDEYASIAYVFADDNEDRIKFFFESFNKEMYLCGAYNEFPYTFKALTDEDYRQHLSRQEAEIEKLKELDRAEKEAKAAKQDQPQLQGKEETMTEQVKEQPQAATEQPTVQVGLTNMAAQTDKYLEAAKAAGKTEVVEYLTFANKIAGECAGITDETTAAQLTAALAAAEAAKLKALGKEVPAWLTAIQALLKAKLDGRTDDEATQEAVFEGLLSKITKGVSEDGKERVRPILAEHVKAHLPKDEPAPAFLDKAIQEGAQVAEQQAVKAAKAAAAAGLSETSAIAAQRITLTEDRAKLREAISELPVYNPTGQEMVAHNTEVVRNFYISSGGGGSSRASEPLFSDEFVETCANIAKVALGTAVVVGVGYVAFKGAQALYDWATD